MSYFSSKCLAVGLSALALSGLCLAGSYPSSENNLVTMPIHKSKFFFSIGGLYVKPQNDNLEYGSAAVFIQPTILLHEVRTVNTTHHWGLRAEAGFFIGDSNDSLSVNYTYFNRSDSLFDPTDDLLGTVTVYQTRTSGDESFTEITARTTFKLNDVNLEYGHFVDYNLVSTRYVTLMNYTHLDHSLMSSGVLGDDENRVERGVMNSEFHGFGLGVGTDSFFHVNKNVDIVAHARAALIAGKISLDVYHEGSTNFTNPGFNQTPVVDNRVEEQCTMVPKGELRFGAVWRANGYRHGNFSVEVGYQMAGYFNSIIHQMAITGDFEDIQRRDGHDIFNYSHRGGYLDLKWTGSMA